MTDYYQTCGIPKGEPRKRRKGREKRAQSKDVHMVRMYVFARERNVCRCCRVRPAESMHELRFRSLGGRVSRQNSVALCGDGVNGCHGLMQRLEVGYTMGAHFGAEGPIWFQAATQKAADWMRIKVGESIESPTMFQCEVAE